MPVVIGVLVTIPKNLGFEELEVRRRDGIIQTTLRKEIIWNIKKSLGILKRISVSGTHQLLRL